VVMMDTLMDNFNKKALEAEKLGAKALVLVVHDSAMAERLDLGALIREIKDGEASQGQGTAGAAQASQVGGSALRTAARPSTAASFGNNVGSSFGGGFSSGFGNAYSDNLGDRFGGSLRTGNILQ
ncbi:unnamed protein product, partial [Symbiodinium sp. KB8]